MPKTTVKKHPRKTKKSGRTTVKRHKRSTKTKDVIRINPDLSPDVEVSEMQQFLDKRRKEEKNIAEIIKTIRESTEAFMSEYVESNVEAIKKPHLQLEEWQTNYRYIDNQGDEQVGFPPYYTHGGKHDQKIDERKKELGIDSSTLYQNNSRAIVDLHDRWRDTERLTNFFQKDMDNRLIKIDFAVRKKLKNDTITKVDRNWLGIGKDGYLEGSWTLDVKNKGEPPQKKIFDFHTFYAGGYDVQRLHVRTKYNYKVIKQKKGRKK